MSIINALRRSYGSLSHSLIIDAEIIGIILKVVVCFTRYLAL